MAQKPSIVMALQRKAGTKRNAMPKSGTVLVTRTAAPKTNIDNVNNAS